MKRLAIAVLGTLVLLLAFSSSAFAAVNFNFTEVARQPSVLAPGTINRGDEYVGYSVKLKNTGPDPTVGETKIAIGLPGGMRLGGASGESWSCNTTTAVCSSSKTVPAGVEFPALKLAIWIFSEAPDSPLLAFAASGGGAVTEATAQDGFAFGPETHFGLLGLSAGACTTPPVKVEIRSCKAAEDAGAQAETTAGAHPFAATSSLSFAQHISPKGTAAVVQSVRDLFTELPPGFIGNPQAIGGICTAADVRESTTLANQCSDNAAVGGIGVNLPGGLTNESSPLYRIVPEAGYVAAFAFRPVEQTSVTIAIRVKVRSNGDYGVSAVAPLPPEAPELLGLRFATLCGYGASLINGEYTRKFAGCRYPGTEGANKVPFLTNQTRCSGGEPVTKVTIDSFQSPGAQTDEGSPVLSDPNWKVAEAKSPEITGCDQLEFEPRFEGRPTTTAADSPSGLDFHLHLPQGGLADREALAEAHLRDSVVTLPVGMAVNPSAASGLGACGSTQVGLTTAVGASPAHFTGKPDSCPAASKLGTVEVITPLLDKPLFGSVYLAKQFDNPFGSLLAIYISVDDAATGIVVKLAGKVAADHATGQLTASFEENPQVPFEDLDLHLFEGPRASLRTPATCGPKATEAIFTPWSAPESGPPAVLTDSFETTAEPGGGSCPSSPSGLINSPRLSTGTLSPRAGAYSPFVLNLSREDGSQELKGVNAILPPGLTARLTGTATCSEAQLARAIARSRPGEGTLEQADPSCPPGSEIGTVDIAAGAGPTPFHTIAHAYLTPPYKGAPLSMAVVAPAVAGPFDLGTVVVRSALYIDPVTTRVTVKSDPIPTILEGIPLDVRSISVRIDRPRFTLNPTSCALSSVGATALGLASDASLSARFQVGECSALKFKPNLKVKLHGATKRGAYQRLTAMVTYPEGLGYANIARAAVTLPHSEFLAQEHIRTVCTRVQFAAHACPAGSVYGHATATTPLLDEPLSGPVYLRSSNNLLPDLVVVLRGPDSRPIEVELAGRTDSKNGGLRNTFDFVPDAPVSKFTLTLLGGKKSLIVNSRDLCKNKKQRATVRLTAQNGKMRDFRPVVGNDCGKKHGKHKRHKH